MGEESIEESSKASSGRRFYAFTFDQLRRRRSELLSFDDCEEISHGLGGSLSSIESRWHSVKSIYAVKYYEIPSSNVCEFKRTL